VKAGPVFFSFIPSGSVKLERGFQTDLADLKRQGLRRQSETATALFPAQSSPSPFPARHKYFVRFSPPRVLSHE